MSATKDPAPRTPVLWTAPPAPPVRQYSFTDWQTNNPTAPPPGDRMDAEYDRANAAISQTITWAETSLNTDGSLRAGTVGESQLVSGLFDDIAQDIIDDVQPLVDQAQGFASATAASSSTAQAAASSASAANTAAGGAAVTASNAAVLASTANTSAQGYAATAQTAATQAQNADNHAEGAAALAQDYADVTQAWAEHMPDTIPPNILAVMGITGDHWSSRWWANQAVTATGAVNYRGTWNPVTNTPTLATGGLSGGVVSKKGDYYLVSVTGTSVPIDGQTTWTGGDQVVSTGTAWQKVHIDYPAGPFLPLIGGTMSGPITLAGNATQALQAVPLQQLPRDVKYYGAIMDGSSHPLSTQYATLAAAQAVYPHAVALTDEIDWAAIQACVNALNTAIVIPAGTAIINRPVVSGAGNIAVVGDGTDVARIVQTTAGQDGWQHNGATHFQMFGITLARNGAGGVALNLNFSGIASTLLLRDVNIRGNVSLTTDYWHDGIISIGPGSIIIDDVNVLGINAGDLSLVGNGIYISPRKLPTPAGCFQVCITNSGSSWWQNAIMLDSNDADLGHNIQGVVIDWVNANGCMQFIRVACKTPGAASSILELVVHKCQAASYGSAIHAEVGISVVVRDCYFICYAVDATRAIAAQLPQDVFYLNSCSTWWIKDNRIQINTGSTWGYVFNIQNGTVLVTIRDNAVTAVVGSSGTTMAGYINISSGGPGISSTAVDESGSALSFWDTAWPKITTVPGGGVQNKASLGALVTKTPLTHDMWQCAAAAIGWNYTQSGGGGTEETDLINSHLSTNFGGFNFYNVLASDPAAVPTLLAHLDWQGNLALAGSYNYTATGGTASRSAQARAADVANVLDYGAGIGGDDALAIRNAIASNKKLIFIPPGTYTMKSVVPTFGSAIGPNAFEIRGRTDTWIIAYGATFLIDNSVSAPAAGAPCTLAFTGNSKNCGILGGTFVGNRTGLTPTQENIGIDFDSVTGMTVRDVKFTGTFLAAFAGVYGFDCVVEDCEGYNITNAFDVAHLENFTIKGCRFQANPTNPVGGITLHYDTPTLGDNVVTNEDGSARALRGGQANDLRVLDCVFQGFANGLAVEAVKGFHVSRTIIRSGAVASTAANQGGMVFYCGATANSAGLKCSNIEVSDCEIYGNGVTAGGGLGTGIFINANAGGPVTTVNIIGNRVYDNAGYGVAAVGSPTGIIIAGNDYATRGGTGVQIAALHPALVTALAAGAAGNFNVSVPLVVASSPMTVPPGGSIQAAHDALPATGGSILLAANTTYVVTAQISFTKPNVHISAPSWGTIVRRDPGYANTPVINSTGAGCIVEGFTIDGNSVVGTVGTAFDLAVSGANTIVRNMQMLNSAGAGSIALSGNNSRATGNRIIGLGTLLSSERGAGIWAVNHQTVMIDHNTINGMGIDGIEVDGEGTQVIGNQIWGCHTYTGNPGGQLVTYPASSGSVGSGISFIGNYVGPGGSNLAHGIEAGSANMLISGNTVDGVQGYGILVISGGCTITGNYLRNIAATSGLDGIEVLAAATGDLVITGNRIADDRATPVMRAGIWINTGSADHYTITGNTISGYTFQPIVDQGTGHNKVIAHNTGMDGFIPTVASAATIQLFMTPLIKLTGTTTVTAIDPTVGSATGRTVTILPVGAVQFTAGATIANTVTTVANVPLLGVFDGTLWHFK